MSNYPGPFGTYGQPQDLQYESRVSSTTLAAFFNAVYGWMAAGLALTATVAWWVSTHPAIMAQVFRGPALIILFIAQIALVIAISAAIRKINATVATGMFLLYSALNGLTLSIIFVVYTHTSIAAAFVVTAGMFGAMSLYGFVTKTDLSRFGALLFMALIGLVIASVVNMFWANSTLYWIVTYAGVLIFVGLTAYDTQKLKMIALQTANDPAMAARLSVYGALNLYLDFINLFLFLLRIMGNRRS
jgi:FtsH-binding integral membrane protein